jgi:thiol-disulfide isomerase/thioredoxin
MKYRWLLVLAVAIAAATLGVYFGKAQNQGTSNPAPNDPTTQAAGAALAKLSVATPEGSVVKLQQWAGKVLVINFWATWCPPCREEMPEFSRMQEKLKDNSVQFVGIGIDTPDNIISFKKTYPVSYPLLMGTYETLKLTVGLGNASSALPFTAILDKQGNLAYIKTGKMDEAELSHILTPLYSAGPALKQ